MTSPLFSQSIVFQPKGAAVVLGWSVFAQSGLVDGGGITKIARPAIGGKFDTEQMHQRIAVLLSKDGSRRDSQKRRVAAHHAGVRDAGERAETIAVHEQVFGAKSQRRHGTMHRQIAGLRDVILLDLSYRRLGDGPRYRIAHNVGAQGLALPGTQELAVGEARVLVVGRQHHGGGHHRSSQTAAPGFIESRFYATGGMTGK